MNEAETCRKLVRPKIEAAGWESGHHSYSEQDSFTAGRIIVPGGKPRRLKKKVSDFLLRYTRDITLAVVEAKSDKRPAGDGLHQAKDYAGTLGLKFAYPKLMAWEGALAVVPPECDGLVVSTEYPVFEVNEEKVLPEVLDVYFRTPSVWPEISGASTGTNVRRRRLNPADFLRYKFPLPSRATQEKLRAVKAKAEEARKLREPAQKELDAILPAILDRAFQGEL